MEQVRLSKCAVIAPKAMKGIRVKSAHRYTYAKVFENLSRCNNKYLTLWYRNNSLINFNNRDTTGTWMTEQQFLLAHVKDVNVLAMKVIVIRYKFWCETYIYCNILVKLLHNLCIPRHHTKFNLLTEGRTRCNKMHMPARL